MSESEISITTLGVEDWATYRDVRLNALRESPSAFAATFEEESRADEAFWRLRMQRSLRLLATQGSTPLGVVSLGRDEDDPTVGEVFALYVTPQARNRGVSWRLVQAAADHAQQEGMRQLLYWVGTENAPAIAFAANFGFRPVGERRETTASGNAELGDFEMAMALSLVSDPGAVPNPNRARVTPTGGAYH